MQCYREPRGENAFAMLTRTFNGWEVVVSGMEVVYVGKCIEAPTRLLLCFLPPHDSSPLCARITVRRNTMDLKLLL
jgi:hypothetical protein